MVTVHRELEGLEPASINPDGTMNYASSTIRYDIPAIATILYDGGSFERSFESDILIGLTPAGVAQDIHDFSIAISEGDGVGAVLAGVGFIPVVGDGVKAGGKVLRETLQSGDEIIDVAKQIGPTGDAGGDVLKQLPKLMQNSAKPTKKGAGTRFSDPDSKGGNSVRVMRGNPNSPNPSQQVDYVKQTKNGQSVDASGKPAASNSQEAHIPKEKFKYDND